MQNLLELIKSVMVSDDVRQKAADLLYAIAEEMHTDVLLPLGWVNVLDEEIAIEYGCQVHLRVYYFDSENIAKMTGFLKYTGFTFGVVCSQYEYVYDEVFKADGVAEAIDFGKRATPEAVGMARARLKELIEQNNVYIPAVQE